MARALIVNADDFGQSAGVTAGICEAYEGGIVTSTSLMVSWPSSSAAARYARLHPSLSVGLHLDLGEWCYRGGMWEPLYHRVDVTNSEAVACEVRAQVDRCCDLLGRPPTHIDSHQHVHRREPTRSIVTAVAAELEVPLRHVTPTVRYRGDFYGQTADGRPLPERIADAALIGILRALEDGVTELGCHPGYAQDLSSMYRGERTTELRTLCGTPVRQALDASDIRLISFAELGVV